MAIQVNDDRMTLAVAGAPQIYLSGAIDADAPRRVEALIRSWKIPPRSDVYLDSPGGDVNAGIALGRLFRTSSMTTHLGTPRRRQHSPSIPAPALCLDACAFAYFGGLYRWAPTGRDRIGLHGLSAMKTNSTGGDPAQRAAGVASYLKDMGIDAATLAPTPTASGDAMAWLSAEPMLSAGLANNGRLPLTATYQLSPGSAYLALNQIVRNGVYRMTIMCKPDGLTLTSYYIVGADRARKIAMRGRRSFFEVDGREALPPQRTSVTTLNEAIVTSRPYPSTQLARLVNGRSMGAWLTDSNAVRYGFTIWLAPVRNSLREYAARCDQVMQRPATRSP
jgi:hypothetical protein